MSIFFVDYGTTTGTGRTELDSTTYADEGLAATMAALRAKSLGMRVPDGWPKDPGGMNTVLSDDEVGYYVRVRGRE